MAWAGDRHVGVLKMGPGCRSASVRCIYTRMGDAAFTLVENDNNSETTVQTHCISIGGWRNCEINRACR